MDAPVPVTDIDTPAPLRVVFPWIAAHKPDRSEL
jgi:hypothetical protein